MKIRISQNMGNKSEEYLAHMFSQQFVTSKQTFFCEMLGKLGLTSYGELPVKFRSVTLCK